MLRRISVVLASYNGIKFIGEQLDSIREQIKRPDEVIIADDKSTDRTFEYCKQYVVDNNLLKWTVYRNTQNLGVNKNFREALKRATGDYIFTCDQDDVWTPDKISSMIQVMDERPEILLLCSNYLPMRDGEIIHAHVRNISRDDGTVIPMRLKKFWLGNLRPGCTFCFRRELLSRFSIMDVPERLHDSMLWKYAIVADGLYLLNRQLILYRRHESNSTNQFDRKPITLKQRIEISDSEIEFHRKFLDCSEKLGIPPKNQKALKGKMKFLERRKKILSRHNTFLILLFVLFNMKYYPTLRNALSDIYAALKLKG